jgi:DNA-binding winged helix-turn-helix (wHTH) protein/TolB-like protein/tetratricopeptide (TPR) repeat protein
MNPERHHAYQFGPFCLDLRQRLLLRDETSVPLTPKLFETLLALLEQAGAVVTKDALMNRVWPDAIVEERSLSQNIFLLRKALGEDARGRHYIETIPKVGYRFLATVATSAERPATLIVEKRDRLRIVANEEEVICASVEDSLPQTLAIVNRERARRKPPRAIRAALILLVAMLTAGFYFYFASRADETAAGLEVSSIAVLPFKPLAADEKDEYLGLGMADTLIGRLSHLRKVAVRPTSAIRRYSATDQNALAAGREQMVDAVLEGSIQRSGDRIRLAVQLVSVRDGAPIWSYRCDELCKDLFTVQDSISERVAEALTLHLTGEERKQLTKHDTEDPEAYHLYIKGRYFWNKRTGEGFKKALDYFHQAIDRDSNYALAYVGVADSYTMLADYDWIAPAEASAQAKAAATQALAIDEQLAEAHASLADIKRFFDWDWPGAEREYRRAIELNPNYSTAHQWYGEFLSAMGRPEEAVREMKLAQELDPLSTVVQSATAWVYFFARQPEQAIEQCERVIEMDKGFSEVYSQLRRAYEAKGMYREAMEADGRLRKSRNSRAAEKLESRGPFNARSYWQRILELTKQDLQNKEAVEVRLAEAYAQLGDKDRAMEWLERAYEKHSFWMPFLNVHPHLEPLHADPRFQDLLRRIGLSA